MPRSDAQDAAAVDLNDLESMDLSADAAPLERVEPFMLACVQALGPDARPDARRAAAARIRLLAKHRSDIRELTGVSGAIPALVPLLRSLTPWRRRARSPRCSISRGELFFFFDKDGELN